jgi:fatty acid amide hydrolase
MADRGANPTDWGAAEIARRIAARDVSAISVVEAHIARIEEVNGRINAVVVKRFDEARREAELVDRQLTSSSAGQAANQGMPEQPLLGVPITIKECFYLAGTAATIGLDRRRNEVSTEDGLLVQRLRRAGAIVLGKTNLPQMMIWHESDNPLFGRTNNPWDLARTPGGSTGGEAAIVAARGSPLGLGNDLGGSIRIPCHWCGIHGLKPSSLRLPRVGTLSTLRGFESIVTQAGPMARRVEDLPLALSVLADNSADGYVAGDVVPGKLGDPAAVAVERLKIACWTDDGLFPSSPGIQRAVREAAAALRARGAEIIELDAATVSERFALQEVFDTYCSLLSADGAAGAAELTHGSTLDWRVSRMMWMAALWPVSRMTMVTALRRAGQRWMARLVSAARARTADAFWRLTLKKNTLARGTIDWLREARFDAILCPPHALPAPQHVKAFDLISAACQAFVFNMLGLPAGVVSLSRIRPGEDISRSAGRDKVLRQAAAVERGSAGLPVGVQVVAMPWREDVVLALMAALEADFQSRPDYPGNHHVPVDG